MAWLPSCIWFLSPPSLSPPALPFSFSLPSCSPLLLSPLSSPYHSSMHTHTRTHPQLDADGIQQLLLKFQELFCHPSPMTSAVDRYMYTSVYPSICQYMSVYSSISHYVSICLYIPLCQYMSVYPSICQYMSVYVSI